MAREGRAAPKRPGRLPKMNQIQVAAQAQPVQPVQPFAPVQLGLSEESKLALLDVWRSIVKRKWPILGLAAALAVVAGAVSLAMTPVYRSTATVLVEQGKAKVLSIEDVYAGAAQTKEHYQTQVEILKSREVAQRAVSRLKLWNHPELDPRKGEESITARLKAMVGFKAVENEWTEARLAEATTRTVLAATTVEPVRLSQLVKVSYESPDKALAQRMANELAAAYIEADRVSKYQLTENVNAWLGTRAKELRDKLETSEKALQEYREKAGLVDLAGSPQLLAREQIVTATQRLADARASRTRLEGSYRAVAAIKNGDYSSVPVVVTNGGVQDQMRRVADESVKVSTLSEQLGPNSTRLQEAQAALAKAKEELRITQLAVANSVMQEYTAARSSEQALEAMLTSATASVQDVNRKEFTLATLQREFDSNLQLYNMFMNRAKETDASSELQAAVARVVDPAVIAEFPVRPKKLQIVLVALVLGLLIGAAGSMLLDRLDNTIKGSESAEAKLHQPVLTALPMVPPDETATLPINFLKAPSSHHAEAIRTARTGVMLSSVDEAHRVLLVTSSVPAEGKTSTAINLALALAQTKRTLLIDADMRKPQVGVRLGLAANAKGLSNLVTGSASLKECVHQVEDSSLVVMPSGDIPPNPLDLLVSQRFKDMLAHLKPQLDFIVIDSPPVELVSDALALAPQATGTVYVVKAMQTPYPAARNGINRLQRAGGHMLGVILNGLDYEKAQRYYGESVMGGYGVYSYYGTEEAAGAKPQA